MSSPKGVRQRFPEKHKKEEFTKTGQKLMTEEEAVIRASNVWRSHFLFAFVLSLLTPIVVLLLLPSPITPKEYLYIPPPPLFEGPLTLNNDLGLVDKIYDGQVHGPESLWVEEDRIYTGTLDGWVNVLHEGKVEKLVRFGKEPCGGFENENTCGRPLGMRMAKNGLLIVCDAYHGLFQVNVTTGEYETLYAATTPVNGHPSKFLNDLDIDDQGRIYFTDTSTQWHRNQFFNILLEGDDTGRLLMYDPKTKSTEQIRSGLIFPNGVQVTPDQSAVLVCELATASILRYDMTKKVFSVWADGLPGHPDNIRYDPVSQSYWVGMALVRYSDRFSFLDFFAKKPWLRGILAKVISVSNFETMNSFVNMLSPSQPKALAVQLNKDGNIIDSVQDLQASVVKSVSEVHVAPGALYMGSFFETFIARLDLNKRKPLS